MPVRPPISTTGSIAASRATRRTTTTSESAGRLPGSVGAATDPVAGDELAPVAGPVAESGYVRAELLQRAQQPCKVATLPGARAAEAAPVEVQQPDGALPAQLYVVRVQVRVADARVVKRRMVAPMRRHSPASRSRSPSTPASERTPGRRRVRMSPR